MLRPTHVEAVAEFEDSIAGFGSVIHLDDIEKYDPVIAGQCKWIRARMLTMLTILGRYTDEHKVVTETLHLHFVRNPTLNAIALTGAKYDHIGITMGSLLTIPTFFDVILSHPMTLRNIGDPSEETPLWDDMSGCTWTSDFMHIAGYLHRQHVSPAHATPVNDQRRDTAHLLAAIALDFLILHELAHIIFGHTTFGVRNNAPFYELGRTYESPSAYEESQALELHADGHAGLLLLDLLLNVHLSSRQEWEHRFWESKREALYFMFLSLNFLFYVMDQDATSLSDTTFKTHPHTCLRFIHVLEIIKRHGRSLVECETAIECWQNAMSSIVDAANVLKIPTSMCLVDPVKAGNRISFLSAVVLAKVFPHLRIRIKPRHTGDEWVEPVI